MKTDFLKQYMNLRESLLKEKAELESRLSQITEALGEPRRNQHKERPTQKRIRNSISLKEAVLKVIKSKALSKPEILDAVQKAGYRFSGSNPMASLNTLLYSNRSFKNVGGRFIAK